MTLVWSGLCTLGLCAGFAIGATQDLPAPQIDEQALTAPSMVIAKVDKGSNLQTVQRLQSG
jgi:hypothetical protein